MASFSDVKEHLFLAAAENFLRLGVGDSGVAALRISSESFVGISAFRTINLIAFYGQGQ
jgi:hypothetical protein